MKDFNPYKFVQERKTSRPFNDKMERDGNWNYMHETDVWSLIERMKSENNKKLKIDGLTMCKYREHIECKLSWSMCHGCDIPATT